jgi:hypothetical protein
MIARFHRAAEQELAAAMEVGEERGRGLGQDLLDEVERAVALLCEFPDIGERLDDKRRRFPLRRFPFGSSFELRAILYEFWRSRIVVNDLAIGANGDDL